MTTKLILDF